LKKNLAKKRGKEKQRKKNTNTNKQKMTTDKATASISNLQTDCESFSSRHIKAQSGKTSRDARGCVVCKHEGRKVTQQTDYCKNHDVCLCRRLYTRKDEKNKGFNLRTSQESDDYNYEWTCWNKYHRYYFPNGLFNAKGNIVKQSMMNKESKRLKIDRVTANTKTQDSECSK